MLSANKINALSRQGAEVVDPRNPRVAKHNSFSGTGYRLGQSSSDSEGMFYFMLILAKMQYNLSIIRIYKNKNL